MRNALTGLAIGLALAGCGDPLDKVEHIADVELADDQPTAAALPSSEELAREGGFFAGLFEGADAVQTDQAATGQAGIAEDKSAKGGSAGDVPAAEAEAAVSHTAEPEKRSGLFGLFRGGRAAGASGPDMLDVPVGAVLPYGSIARVCDADRGQMGTRIDKAPARGNGFALYDSNPQSTAARTFYVTGFSDGCPRQFTAALAMFGAPSMHEQLRYGQPSEDYPYSDTDKAYEKIKSQVCRVGKRKPCGSAISRLERDTVFISTYENFGNNARWSDILLHDGQVMAAAIKTP